MAISTVVADTSLTIEVQNGVDEAGDPKWSKKTFSGVKADAENQDIYDTAEAIKTVLSADTNRTLLNVTSKVFNE